VHPIGLPEISPERDPGHLMGLILQITPVAPFGRRCPLRLPRRRRAVLLDTALDTTALDTSPSRTMVMGETFPATMPAITIASAWAPDSMISASTTRVCALTEPLTSDALTLA
jgi:hypothetical protein